MTNDQIADQLILLGKLTDIHGESSFKSKAYAGAAFQIEKLPEQLADMSPAAIAGLKGIGEAIAAKINELLATGHLQTLEKYLQQTPPGVVEMLQIKGLGAKKIHTIWQEMGLESMGELLYACTENRLTLYKGFGAKTQQNVKEAIEFFQKSQGRFLFQQTEQAQQQLLQLLQQALAPARVALTGSAAMHEDIIDRIDFATDAAAADLEKALSDNGFTYTIAAPLFSFRLAEGLLVQVETIDQAAFLQTVFRKTCDQPFYEAFCQHYPAGTIGDFASVDAFLTSLQLEALQADVRRGSRIIDLGRSGQLPELIQPASIRGIIHSHSNWSDGAYSLEEMAVAAQQQGFEYLVISDHSKSAFYANGLTEDRIRAQHQQIDELNQQLAPFKIFKSIESDILNEGQLDYSDALLSTFDLVIASVHSNLKMPEAKAMQRLLTAIRNPYTTILGHMTGRLLLSRAGYPVDHRQIIDACADNNVVIELNAHPRRLDMDWRWIEYALEKGVLLSIDPDAHSISGFSDVRYGVLAARKGLLTPASNLSSFSLPQLEAFLQQQRRKKGI